MRSVITTLLLLIFLNACETLQTNIDEKTKQEQDEHLRKKYKKFKEERRKTQAEDNKKKAVNQEKSLKDELRELATKLQEEQKTA